MAPAAAAVMPPSHLSMPNAPSRHSVELLPLAEVVPAPAGAAKAACDPAFDYAGSINDHPQLSSEEKQALLWVLAQAPSFARLVHADDVGGAAQPEWVHCSSSSMLGIDISRQEPVPPERVHKMRGITIVPLSAAVAYDLLTEFEEMQKWDAMLLSMDVTDLSPRAFPVLHVGTFASTYGVPGMSWLFNDRQFLCRGVGVAFPDGTRALAVFSPEGLDEQQGAPKPRTVRAHMGVSGYVVSPYGGKERAYLGSERSQITMVLQVDPKGGVPLPVYNTVSMMMPMNLQRVKLAAARLKPAEREAMLQRQAAALAASVAEADKVAAAGGKKKAGGKQ